MLNFTVRAANGKILNFSTWSKEGGSPTYSELSTFIHGTMKEVEHLPQKVVSATILQKMQTTLTGKLMVSEYYFTDISYF